MAVGACCAIAPGPQSLVVGSCCAIARRGCVGACAGERGRRFGGGSGDGASCRVAHPQTRYAQRSRSSDERGHLRATKPVEGIKGRGGRAERRKDGAPSGQADTYPLTRR
eukprot:5826416-Prymnesium_polylepis.2